LPGTGAHPIVPIVNVSPDESLSFHNVAEFVPVSGGGVALHRVPAEVRCHLSGLGKFAAIEATGVEIRFVSRSPGFRLVFDARPSAVPRHAAQPQEVTVFRGDFYHSRHPVRHGGRNVLSVFDPANELETRFAGVDEASLRGRFSPEVWRICFARNEIIFHELDTLQSPRRPPRAEESPARRWLAYGSSITQGADASSHHLASIYGAARQLGVDVLNLGFGGSCLCEPAMADYLTARDDWELALFELGVNMRSRFSPEAFESRVSGLLNLARRRRGTRPVFVTGIYLNREHRLVVGNGTDPGGGRQAAFTRIVRERALEAGLHFIDALEILTRFDGLTADLLHPSDYGYQEMAWNLARRMQPHLEPEEETAAAGRQIRKIMV